MRKIKARETLDYPDGVSLSCPGTMEGMSGIQRARGI